MNTITVKQLWRFPVKSFAGEQLEVAEFLATGLLGDRAFALIEKDSNKVVTAKSIKRFPDLLDCRAEYTASPRVGEEPPPVLCTWEEEWKGNQ
ncbi:MOSC domain-containing protein [Opitutia bacterium ISCC 51]|nr:MOSC domain-containing protein [Opitutae bacterium ISCC 51]QXD27603.1 MOSC domain-containing protein [Opitutae bacterium ISCC 52]